MHINTKMASEIREMARKSTESLESVLLESESGLIGAAAPPGYDGRLTYYLSSDTSEDVERLPDWLVGNIVNLKPINDIGDLNAFFKSLNAKLPNHGVFVGCVETQQQVKARLFKQWPWLMALVIYVWMFLFRRVLPKLGSTKGIYQFFSKGRRNLLSKTEVLGRLVYAGYEIIEYREIDQLSYFFAMKMEPPSADKTPSTGPVLKMKRVVKGGRMAYIYKLRTMHPYAQYIQEYVYENNQLEKNGKLKNDFRITSWGRLLRKLWIDEIPMIYNVLKGDIKFVGVRPLSAHYLGLYPADVIELRLRHKPGLIPPFYVDLPESFEGYRCFRRALFKGLRETALDNGYQVLLHGYEKYPVQRSAQRITLLFKTNLIRFMIRLDDTIMVNENLMVADLEGEMVLLDTQSGIYFGLNAVGSRIWELASEPQFIKDIVSTLVSEYDVSEEQLEDDVLNFVNSLFQRSLVHVIAAVEV